MGLTITLILTFKVPYYLKLERVIEASDACYMIITDLVEDG